MADMKKVYNDLIINNLYLKKFAFYDCPSVLMRQILDTSRYFVH